MLIQFSVMCADLLIDDLQSEILATTLVAIFCDACILEE